MTNVFDSVKIITRNFFSPCFILLRVVYTSEHATQYSLIICLLPTVAVLHFHFVFGWGQNLLEMTLASEQLIENYFLSLKE